VRRRLLMLLRRSTLEGIRSGAVTLAFRRWRRPTVRAGGTLLTGAGQLCIASVTVIDPRQITDDEARQAGYTSRTALLAELSLGAGDVYRVELGELRPDPRIALRNAPAATDADHERLRDRLRRLDVRAERPWTVRTLQIIRQHPGVRAGTLCGLSGQEKEPFKINVRKLKNLGLTESLEVGYRLSPRGEALLDRLQSGGG
jgi:hypothetical protein